MKCLVSIAQDTNGRHILWQTGMRVMQKKKKNMDDEKNMQSGQIEKNKKKKKKQKNLCHNKIVDDMSTDHIFAKVSWYVPFSEFRQAECSGPVQAYKPDAYDLFGESGFMPLLISEYFANL